MNSRIAKKISCCPVDPYRRPSKTSPYTGKQWIEAGRVQRKSFNRAFLDGPARASNEERMNAKLKWGSCKNTKTHRPRYLPGFTGERLYTKKQ